MYVLTTLYLSDLQVNTDGEKVSNTQITFGFTGNWVTGLRGVARCQASDPTRPHYWKLESKADFLRGMCEYYYCYCF